MSSVPPNSAKFKVCKKCGPPGKPIGDFYKRPSSRDGLDCYCKPCKRAINRANREKNKSKSADEREEWSTSLGRDILREQGIPCSVGSDAGLAYVDLLAWGCVQVEVKVSRPIEGNPNKFKWTFTDRQHKVGFKGVFLFIALLPDARHRVFVVPCDDPHITKANGATLITAVSVTIESSHTNAKNWDWLKAHENKFEHIEVERQRQMVELRKGATESIKLALAEIANRAPNLSIEELPLFKKNSMINHDYIYRYRALFRR